jgi:hypothetical protein
VDRLEDVIQTIKYTVILAVNLLLIGHRKSVDELTLQEQIVGHQIRIFDKEKFRGPSIMDFMYIRDRSTKSHFSDRL